MTGRTILHYRVTAKLGEGGMSAVYKAEDTKLGRPVALKFLREELVRDPVALKRFQREARTASALNHPNICTVYEVAEAEGQTLIAMEFVEGHALSALISAEGLSTHDVLRHGAQIAEALAHSHDRGVVHRDLKSANVMVTLDGRVKVLDFGLAKRVAGLLGDEDSTRTQTDPMTQEGTITGTLAYMSPEVLRGEGADTRSDIWSFGVLLYEMTAGRLPFQGKNLFDLTAAVLKEPVPELPAKVNAGLRAVIERCLCREPGQRYQRGSEAWAALEAIQSTSKPLPGTGVPPVSRRRWLWLAGAGAVAAGVTGGIFWSARRSTYRPPPSKVPEANEYFRRAMLFLTTQQDLPRARQLLEKALELDPHFADARAWYGFSHLLMVDQGWSSDSGWLYKAEEELRRALKDNPYSAKAHSSLAWVYGYQGRKELMLEEARKAIQLNPEDRESQVVFGIYYASNGEYERSLAVFKKTLDSDPLFFPARMNVGESLRLMGDAQGSIREQKIVLEQDASNIYALHFLAQAHMTLGDLPKSRQALERA